MHFVFCSMLLHLFHLQVMLEDDIPGQKRSAPIDFDGESHFFFFIICVCVYVYIYIYIYIATKGKYCASV